MRKEKLLAETKGELKAEIIVLEDDIKSLKRALDALGEVAQKTPKIRGAIGDLREQISKKTSGLTFFAYQLKRLKEEL